MQPLWIVIALLVIACAAALVLAWQTQRRVLDLEQALVRRQTESQTQAAAAQMLAKQAEDMARETAAKQALLEARVSEVSVQRGQIEELIQSLSRSRDENVVVDIESALRVAMQQSALTGSAEPLVAALKQADERLARYSQPRLEGVRRAIARDLDAVKALGVADVAALTIKIDEAVRMVDELPLVSQAEPRKEEAARAAAAASAAARPAKRAASAAGESASALPAWLQPWIERWDALTERVWIEARSLVRVTRIDHPEAMFVAPEQAYFLRENLKLRLMNARLALLARQFDTAQADLQSALVALERYFDKSSRRTQLTATLIRQVAAQSRQVGVPRPEATLAALSTAAAGR
ncbi:MAG: uroporphyrinogen-III C-methyltransferase [Piscinibacter sp.]|nr:uroporphyrinogen-III C-methyltransferase [Piscinibacter sp.]